MIAHSKDSVDANRRLIDQQPTYNKIHHVRVELQLYENVVTGQVQGQVLGP